MLTDGEFPEAAHPVESTTTATLADRLQDGEDTLVLDVRAPSDVEAWQISGPGVDLVARPYYEFLDGVPGEIHEELPDDRTVTVVCAKGGASAFVAAELEDAGYDVEHLEGGMAAWARRYEYRELDVGADATVAQYHRPSSGCLAYLVVSGGEAAVVDPLRAFADEYVRDARALGADLQYALDTHVHADHVSGVRTVAEEADATPVMPAPALERGVAYGESLETVADGEALGVGDVAIEAVHAPGHTTGMTAFRVGDVLFTGDGLFVESVARPDLEDPEAARAAARQLHRSLTDRVLALPDDTTVAPGHVSDAATPESDGSYTAPLADVTDAVALLAADEEAFVEQVVDDLPPRPANHEAIIATNLGHADPEPERAFELELGPNNCAASAASDR